MKIGIPKEVKIKEYRISTLPEVVGKLTEQSHTVLVETGAGNESGFRDDDYRSVGATIVSSAAEAWNADLVVKVKEPLKEEFPFLREGLLLFTYFHFAASKEMTEELLKKKVDCLAYELVEGENHSLPLLSPMSEIAGKLAAQQAAKYLEKTYGGKGVLMGGAHDAEPARVLVFGTGVVGMNAAIVAAGMGASVFLIDINPAKLAAATAIVPRSVGIDPKTMEKKEFFRSIDAFIGAVLIPGARAPKMLSADDLDLLEPGSVLVDVAIDQGGCFETSRPTTHVDPVYSEKGIVHYCVANMPGAVPKTASVALSRASAPYLMLLAEQGIGATEKDQGLRKDLAISKGLILNPTVEALL